MKYQTLKIRINLKGYNTKFKININISFKNVQATI